jgi:hypothetical protein
MGRNAMKKSLLPFICLFFLISVSVFSQSSSPVLILPENNATFVSATATLTWQSVSGATGYLVQAATDSNQILNGLLVDTTNAAGPQFTFNTGDLQGNTVYYWRVVARFSNIWGPPSQIRCFRTAGTASQETVNLINYVNNLVGSGALNSSQGGILTDILQNANNQITRDHDVAATVHLIIFKVRVFLLGISGMIPSSNAQVLQAGADYIISVIRGGDNIAPVDLKDYMPGKTFSLKQNYPNPFNPSTTIEYSVPAAGLVSLKIYDIQGREVATLVDKEQNAGYYITSWNASNFSSGVYFYKLTAGSFTQTKKLLLTK